MIEEESEVDIEEDKNEDGFPTKFLKISSPQRQYGEKNDITEYYKPLALETKPAMPLLFIQENSDVAGNKSKPVCNICQKVVHHYQESVKCSNLCGHHQHLDCINATEELKDVVSAGIIWKCNECCNLDSSRSLLSSELENYDNEDLTSQGSSDNSQMEINSHEPSILSSLSHSDYIPDIKGEKASPQSNPGNLNVELMETEVLENHSALQRQVEPILREESVRDNASSKIQYVMLDNGSRAGKPKLYDSKGFSYFVRKTSSRGTVWQCIRCSGWQRCQAFINQRGKSLTHKCPHSHPPSQVDFVAAKSFNKGIITFEIEDIKNAEILSTCIKEAPKKRVKQKMSVQTGGRRNINKKLTYVELQDEVEGKNSPKLIDTQLGFVYNLNKTTERTKIWLCVKAGTVKNCEASVKQVGNYYIRSTNKHTHTSNRKDLAQHKKRLVKDGINKAQHSRSMTRKSLDKDPPPQSVLSDQSEERTNTKHQTPVSKLQASVSRPHRPVFKSHSPAAKSQTPVTKSETLVSNGDDASPRKETQSPSGSPSKHPLALQGKEIRCSTPQKLISIPADDEDRLVNCFLVMDAIGITLTNKVLIQTVQNYFNVRKQVYFPENKPSRGWVLNFVEKHRELSDKFISNRTQAEIGKLSLNRSNSFFDDLGELLNAYYQLDIKTFLSAKNSRRIFNCDSIEVIVNANKPKIPRKPKLNEERKRGPRDNSMKTMHILCCVSAGGESLKPLIINKGTIVFKYEYEEELEKVCWCRCSPNGEVNGEVFCSWLSLSFNQFLISERIPKPVVLFLNGNSCFVSVETIEFALNNGIILYHFHPHTITTSQPLTLSIFPVLKQKYERNFEASLNHNTKRLPKKFFPAVFMKAYRATDIANLSIRGFKEAGICPLDKSALKKFKFVPNKSDNKPFIYEEDEPFDSSFSNCEHYLANTNVNGFSTPAKTNSESHKVKPSVSKTKSKATPNDTKSTKLPRSLRKRGRPRKNIIPVKTEITLEQERLYLKQGYKLALDNVDKLFKAVVDPSVLKLYRQKWETKSEYPDTTFLVWRGLQQLKEVPELLANIQ